MSVHAGEEFIESGEDVEGLRGWEGKSRGDASLEENCVNNSGSRSGS